MRDLEVMKVKCENNDSFWNSITALDSSYLKSCSGKASPPQKQHEQLRRNPTYRDK